MRPSLAGVAGVAGVASPSPSSSHLLASPFTLAEPRRCAHGDGGKFSSHERGGHNSSKTEGKRKPAAAGTRALHDVMRAMQGPSAGPTRAASPTTAATAAAITTHGRLGASSLLLKRGHAKSFDMAELFDTSPPSASARATPRKPVGPVATKAPHSKGITSLKNVANAHAPHTARHSAEPSGQDEPSTARVSHGTRAESNPSPAAPQSAASEVPAAFLARLTDTVAGKAVHWPLVFQHHRELARLPIAKEREDWTRRYFTRRSACPLPDDGTSLCPEVLLCSADTGTGKSVLIPLFLLDAHWASLKHALQPNNYHEGQPQQQSQTQTPRPLPLHSLDAFTAAFKRRSRVCIVVSQPTRLACLEMAKYTATVLATASATASTTNTADRAQTDWAVTRTLLGKRVGYAVGGESNFCQETEIIFATPGYILNALQTPPDSCPTSPRRLQPTALLVDEAHSRELETDLLLSWTKMHIRAHATARAAAAACADGAAVRATHALPLRHVVVMSATMNVPAMLHYLQQGPWGSPGMERVRVEPMLFAAQRERLARLLPATSALTNVSETDPHSVETAVRLLSLQQQQQDTSFTRATPAVSADPAANLSDGSPYRVEEYFTGDIASRFLHSNILFGPWVRDGRFHEATSPASSGRAPATSAFVLSEKKAAQGIVAGATRAKHQGRRQGRDTPAPGLSPSSTTVPALLTAEGQRTFNSLQHFYSLRGIRHGVFHLSQASTLALFLLQLLEAVRLRWASSPSFDASSDSAAPLTVLVFLPGFGEMQLLLQVLEKRCTPASLPNHTSHPHREADTSRLLAAEGNSPGEPMPVLRFGDEVFSVPILHAAAVGSPQEQLDASASCGAPLRLVLSTPVAESSLTIPNVKVVVDSALERRFVADGVTGTMTRLTSLINVGSLRQRAGRAGRTCEGVVIHLAPRQLFLPSATATAPALVRDAPTSSASSKPSTESPVAPTDVLAEPLLKMTPPHLRLPGLNESPSATLLRVKALFPEERTSLVLSCLPAPPHAAGMETALRVLLDAGLLSLDPSSSDASPSAEHRVPAAGLYDADLTRRLDAATLTRKGRVVAALPIPVEQALLVYHAFQFACVEDAVLMACAMTVPALTLSPRLSTPRVEEEDKTPQQQQQQGKEMERGVAMLSSSLIAQYYKHVWTQRRLAGFPVPTNCGTDEQADGTPITKETDAASTATGRHLSEPLALHALLLRWYTCVTQEDVHRFSSEFSINRSALRSVDVSVAQCCQRIIQLLNREEDALAQLAEQTPNSPQQLPQQRQADAEDLAKGRLTPEDAMRLAALSSNESDSPDYYIFHKFLRAPLARKREEPIAEPSATRPARSLLASVSSSSPSLPLQDIDQDSFLLDPTWPAGYRQRLRRSLHRLRQAALARAAQRQGASSRGGMMPQWFGAEAEVQRVFRRHYLSPSSYKTQRRGSSNGSNHAVSLFAGHPVVESTIRARQAELLASLELSGSVRRGGTTPRKPTASAIAASRHQAQQHVLSQATAEENALVFTLGRLEDRLCAAFVAAFARQTLRAEDGGYRRHHRRLLRNWDTLQHDAEHVCTFALDCRAPPRSAALLRGADPDEGSAQGTDKSFVERAAAQASLTPSLVQQALSPFLVGTGLLQLELFSSGRLTAAARFASMGFHGLMPASSTTTAATAQQRSEESAEQAEKQRNGSRDSSGRLRPEVLLYEREGSDHRTNPHASEALANGEASTTPFSAWFSDGNPLVRLAPFGVSLLMAAQSALQRISVDVPTSHESNSPANGVEDSDAPMQKGKVAEKPMVPPETAEIQPSPQRPAVGRDMTAATLTPQVETEWITWAERNGVVNRLSRRDVASLGLAHLLPATPPLPAASDVALSGGRNEDTPSVPSSAPTTTSLRLTPTLSPTTSAPAAVSHQSMLLSVLSPINITGGVYWHVRLPSLAALWMSRHANYTEATSSAQRAGEPPVMYCDVCQCLLVGKEAMTRHCQGTAHLSHLLFAVRHRLHRDDWLALRGEAAATTATTTALAGARTGRPVVDQLASLALHGADGGRTGSFKTPGDGLPVLPMEDRACRTHPLSFLNALQWHAADGANPPLAIAGGLLSTPTQHTILPPSEQTTRENLGGNPWRDEEDPLASLDDVFYHRYAANGAVRSATGPLTAQHVWVLNLSPAAHTTTTTTAALQPQGSTSPRSDSDGTGGLSTALFILAGYACGSTQQYPTAFLFNERHTHVHGLMLCGCGVWRLPAPLPITRFLTLLEWVAKGRGWPGVVFPLGHVKADTAGKEQPDDGVYEGLHWCAACAECPEGLVDVGPCAPPPLPAAVVTGPSPPARQTSDASHETVAAAILLVLHEYVSAHRNMVAYADFMERLVAKMSAAAPSVSRGGLPTASGTAVSCMGEGTWAVQQICAFLDYRRHIAQATQRETLHDVLRDVGCTFAAPPVALVGLYASPGADKATHSAPFSLTVETRFTVPPILPSRLPAPGFARALRRSLQEHGLGGRQGLKMEHGVSSWTGEADTVGPGRGTALKF